MSKKLRIGLMGYGKMGKEIESIAIERGHEIVLKINSSNADKIEAEDLRKCDCIIEFSRPDSAIKNIQSCFTAGVPVIVGTTGWYSEMEKIKTLCLNMDGTLLYASNFSIGVNILFEMNRYLAALMNARKEYQVEINETHHIHKLDKPSGTGITLAEGIIKELDQKQVWSLHEKASEEKLIIHSHREGEVIGKHSVRYFSDVDEIEIVHDAYNRKGFASGAVLAAEYTHNKKGIFTMNDVLGIKNR